jgi:uncharacterized protein YaeQ
VVLGYSGNAFDIWWNKVAGDMARFKNLSVVALEADDVDAAVALLQRGMRLTAMIQDGELQLMSDAANVSLRPRVLKAAE